VSKTLESGGNIEPVFFLFPERLAGDKANGGHGTSRILQGTRNKLNKNREFNKWEYSIQSCLVPNICDKGITKLVR